MENVWVLFVATGKPTFPNFYPIGVFESHDKAVNELKVLPQDKHYQIFELPFNRSFAYINDSGELESRLGIFYHEHYLEEEKE